MPTLIQGGNSISIHKSFWNALMKDSDSLALSQLWLCGFNISSLRKIGVRIEDQLKQYEVKSWKIGTDVNNVVLQEAKWGKAGATDSAASSIYLLARGVSFIGDGINTSRVGASQVGAMKGLISEGRVDLATANITFLESNISFADGFLRPWSALVGHRSLKDQNLRCDIELFALEKWTLYEPLHIRKSMVFKNAVPVSIDTEEYNYTGDKLIERQIQFAFDRYEMNIFPAITEEGISVVPYTKKDYSFSDPQVSYEERNESPAEPQLTYVENKNTNKDVPITANIKGNNPRDPSFTPNDKPNNPRDPLDIRKFYNEKQPIGYDIVLVDENASLGGRLDSLGDILGAAQTKIQGIKGKVGDVTTSVAQGLKAFGADKTAEKLMRANQDFNRNVTAPVADVIGTGQGYITGVDNVVHTVGNVTGASRVDANSIKDSLKR